jgi:succinate dehydrogenase / fumarate reductase membrane anchor subunit
VSLRSPLGRVLGLGAAKDGVSHWWAQRLSAVALVPLTIWFLSSLLRLDVSNAESMRGWLAAPVNTVGALLLVLVLCVHSRLGLQVVVEDYVHQPGTKLVSLVLIDFTHIVAAAIGVFAIVRIAFGVAP